MKSGKQMYFYPAIFYLEDDGYTVVFPDFDYVATQGDTLDEAYEKASEVLGIGIEDAINGEIKLPSPSKLNEIIIDPEIGELGKAVVVIIGVDMSDWLIRYSLKTVRRNITLPQSLDQALRNKKINVSRVCQEALIEELRINDH